MNKLIRITCATLIIGAFMTTYSHANNNVNTIGQTKQVDSSLLNVNFATLQQLQALPGIGKKKAQAIIDYRENHGRFVKLDDLAKVKGIGKKLVSKLANRITI